MSKIFFAIISYLFPHFTRSIFINIKLISITRLKFGLDFFNRFEQNFFEPKDLSNIYIIFIYQKSKLVLNKISSIKSQGVVK